MADGDNNHGYLHQSRKQFRPCEDGGCEWWNEPREFSRWEAWQDMIQSAAYKAHRRTLSGGFTVSLQRGETPPRSVRYLANRWSWSRKKVERFLATAAEASRFRRHQRTPIGDTYLIVKYDVYQPRGDSGETATETAGRQRGDSGETKEKEGEVRGKKEKQPPPSLLTAPAASESQNGHHDFERWWATYPRKVGKRKAKEAWKRLRKSKELPPADQVIAATERLSRSPDWTKEGGKFIPHPTTWLNRGGWEDEPAPANGRGAYGTGHDPREDF